MLATSGVASSVERSLLAATQQRQSPANQPVFGLLNFATDGIKLFAKTLSISSSGMSATTFPVVVVLFIGLVFWDLFVGRSHHPHFSMTAVFAFFVLGTFEIIAVLNFIAIQSAFVGIALVRMVEILILVEIS